jgi:hypothetical protein
MAKPKFMLVVEGDHNDADYIVSVSPITDEGLERFSPLIKAIKGFKPYKTVDPPSKHPGIKPLEWSHDHNWPSGDYGCRPDLGEKSYLEYYSALGFPEDLIEEFDMDYVPHAEGGNIHTINAIYLVRYEKHLLDRHR